jgi:alanyl-tRNA synthetase
VRYSNSGRLLEIANSVFMEYQKEADGFKKLSQQNVDFGGGVERILAVCEDKPDIFMTSLFEPIIRQIEKTTTYSYDIQKTNMRIVADHFTAAVFLISAGIRPSKTEQGYILRRLIRRGSDSFRLAHGTDISSIIEKIVEQYSQTDEILKEKYEEIKNVILEEQQNYMRAITEAQKVLKISVSDEVHATDTFNNVKKISADEAFKMYTTHGLSPSQIKSLGYTFNDQQFAEKMKSHQDISRAGATKKFAGGLADHSEQTVRGHTATHLLHQALRDMFGINLHQTGSNITSERVRFDFNFDRNLTPEELKKIEETVNQKIKENLPVHFEMLPLQKAKGVGAIGLFNEKYSDNVKVYFVGNYSKEFCGGPHVAFTSEIKSFRIIKQENIGKGNRRIYAKVV